MRIFYDVDTQNDFMNSNGALYVPGAESLKENIRLLTEYARAKKIKIAGSVDRHFGTEKYKEREGELHRWGGPFPDHCMVGTKGELKINETRKLDLCSPKETVFERFYDWTHESTSVYVENPLVLIPFKNINNKEIRNS